MAGSTDTARRSPVALAINPMTTAITGSAMKTAHFSRSRDGRLCEHWGIRDELDVLYQVGALTPPEMTTPAQG